MSRRFRWWLGIAGAVAIVVWLGVAETARAGSYRVFQCSPWPVGSGNPGADPYVGRVREWTVTSRNELPAVRRSGSTTPVARAKGTRAAGRGTRRREPQSPTRPCSRIFATRTATRRGSSPPGGDLLIADGNEYWQGRGFTLGTGRSSFGVRLVCAASTCDSNGSTRARAYLRDITLTLRDSSKPTPRLIGELMDPTPSTGGWHRGNRSLTYDASDRGGGVAAYNVTVNGHTAGASFGQCQLTTHGYGRLMRPCSSEPFGRSANGNTVAGPWRNGTNTVRACAWDFGGGGSSNSNCITRQVKVDNEVPDPAFRNSQNPADPELIRAPVDERYSGVEAGKVAYKREGTRRVARAADRPSGRRAARAGRLRGRAGRPLPVQGLGRGRGREPKRRGRYTRERPADDPAVPASGGDRAAQRDRQRCVEEHDQVRDEPPRSVGGSCLPIATHCHCRP